jgi:hypothetical protein
MRSGEYDTRGWYVVSNHVVCINRGFRGLMSSNVRYINGQWHQSRFQTRIQTSLSATCSSGAKKRRGILLRNKIAKTRTSPMVRVALALRYGEIASAQDIKVEQTVTGQVGHTQV